MEADSMHSAIERKCRRDMYSPSDYKMAMKMAKESPEPYVVHNLKSSFFNKKGFQISLLPPFDLAN